MEVEEEEVEEGGCNRLPYHLETIYSAEASHYVLGHKSAKPKGER